MAQTKDDLEAIQAKTFCKWLNSKLQLRGIEPMTSLAVDLSNGVRLAQLLEIMGDTVLKYRPEPRLRVQKAENVMKSLDFIKGRGIMLTNIAAEDIIDGNLKLILGLIWTLILRFTIASITEEGVSAKDGLLLWVQRKTADYSEVDVKDFTWSWRDGLALCALIHKHRPDLIDYDKLDKDDREGNTELAFKIAAESLGIPRLLDVSDLCDANPPDERSVMTYVAGYFHAFLNMNKMEIGSRRVAQFLTVMQGIWSSQNDYQRRILELLALLAQRRDDFNNAILPDNYAQVRALTADFALYKQTQKRECVVERQDLSDLLGNIQTKLKTYGLIAYVPPDGCELRDLDDCWETWMAAEKGYSRALNAKIHEIKEGLMLKAARIGDSLHSQLRDLERDLTVLHGELEDQRTQVALVQQKELPPLEKTLAALVEAEAECARCNVEDNEHANVTSEDLRWELDLFKTSLAKRVAFIDNQIVSRELTNVTPAQLEEFEATFRHFDTDGTNTLTVEEFTAALASHSIIHTEDEIDRLYETLVQEHGDLNYKAFTSLLVELTEDTSSQAQLAEAFREIAKQKDYVTELDLQLAYLPASSVDFVKSALPSSELDTAGYANVDPRETVAFDYSGFLSTCFPDADQD